MSDRNMLSLNCNSEHCNFRTPLQGREQYQAMVAHLQVHSALAHGAALPLNPGAGSDSNRTGRGGDGNVANYVDGSEAGDASSLRSRSRSRSRRRDRTFQCTDCKDRAYETEKGLKYHKQRFCGKPREEGVFPCTACDKVFVNAGLLKVHMGKYHTDHSAPRVGGSHDQRNSNNVGDRSADDAPSSTSNGRRMATDRKCNSNVRESHREWNNEAELQEGREGVPRSPSSYGNSGVESNEMSAVEKSRGLGVSTLEGRQTSGRVGTSSSVGRRNESPADSMWSDSSTVSSTMEGLKSLVKVDMVVKNRVTRVTYRVTSTSPIGNIISKVASKLGTDPKKIQLRMVNGAVADGEVPMRLPRELGLLVDVMEPAENFKNRVINAVVVA